LSRDKLTISLSISHNMESDNVHVFTRCMHALSLLKSALYVEIITVLNEISNFATLLANYRGNIRTNHY